MLTVGSLFSGIGGFELGLERTGGFKTAWQCEKDEFCLKVLAKHWPDVKRFTDIKEMGIEENIPYIDVICGGFPCQDISCAGKGAGIHAERSGLWWEMLRIVRLVRPRYVLVENVAALLNMGPDEVLGSLAEIGYDAEWSCLRASDFGAPHRRERIFIVANTKSRKMQHIRKSSSISARAGRYSPDVPDTESPRLEISTVQEPRLSGLSRLKCGRIFTGKPAGDWPIESGFCRMVNGVPHRVDRLRALGNAIVPQCAEYVGRCILEAEARP